jgi:cytidine deaminase
MTRAQRIVASDQFHTVTAEDRALCVVASNVARNAYAPYSGFAVGAAVRTKSGQVFAGANLENASYGVGICAEIAAITAANSAGDFEVEAIAVVGYKFLPQPLVSSIVTPCGRCRQIILEASHVAGTDIRVLCCNSDLTEIRAYAISELLPEGFGPHNLGVDVRGKGVKPAL